MRTMTTKAHGTSPRATGADSATRSFQNGMDLEARARTRRLVLGAALSCVPLLVGCASGKSGPEPAWPEQSAPAYPQPETSEGPVELAEPAQVQAAPQSGSTLAKRYDGKRALDVLKGKATYYADSLAGNHTANGERYDPSLFTAAHKKLPFGTVARVVRQDNGRETYVKINDRGPFGAKDRIIDLSKAAARELDMLRAGVVSVRVEIVERPTK